MTRNIRFKTHLTKVKSIFKVHKCILGCRSPVFGAMFEHEMLEKNSNEIKIEDMKGKVIEAMLRFMCGFTLNLLIFKREIFKMANRF
jgi:hypothetical protein